MDSLQSNLNERLVFDASVPIPFLDKDLLLNSMQPRCE